MSLTPKKLPLDSDTTQFLNDLKSSLIKKSKKSNESNNEYKAENTEQKLTLTEGFNPIFYVNISELFTEAELKPLANDLYLIMQPDSYKFEVDYANEKITKDGTKYCGVKPLELVPDNWLESAKEALKAFRETYPPELLKASLQYLDEDTKKSLFDLVVEINNEKNNKAETKKTLLTPKELINGNETKKTLLTPKELINDNETKKTLLTPKELINGNETKKTLLTPKELINSNETKQILLTPKELINDNESKKTLSTLVELVNDSETKETLSTPTELINSNESKETLLTSKELINGNETKETLSTSEDLTSGDEFKKTLSTSKESINGNETKETLSTSEELINDSETKETLSTSKELVNGNETKKTLSTPTELINSNDTTETLSTLVETTDSLKTNNSESKKTLSISEELINDNESKKTLSASEELINNSETKKTLLTPKELINDSETKETLSTSEDLTSGDEFKKTLSTSKELLNENETKETLSTLVETTDSLKTNNSESNKTLSTSEELVNDSETTKILSTSKELVNGNESKETLSSEELINSDETKETLSISEELITAKKYQLVNNNETLKEVINLLSKENVLGIDIETTGLDVHIHKLRLIQIASPKNPTIIIDCYKCNPKLIQPLLLNDSLKIFHNAKFDLQFFLALGLEVKQNLFDTMLAYQLINAGKDNLKSSLKEITKKLLNIDLNKDEQVSDWLSDTLTDNQLTYASLDAEILLPLRETLSKAIVTANLPQVAKIEFDCIHAVAMMEFNGMLLDLAQWQNILEDTKVKKKNLEAELKELLILPSEKSETNSKQLTLLPNQIEVKFDLNLDSPKQVLEALKKAGIKCENTNSKTLKKLLPDYPNILKPFLEYKKLAKIISSFGHTLTEKINPVTGRLHCQFWQLGAQSGRFTCSNPNLQQIPRNKETRSCFIANPNYKLIMADYSQIELRIAAEITQDKTMIDAYNRGEDLHKLTASIVLNKPLDEVNKEDRQIAKSANFGLIYGSSINGFRSYAEGNYGISLTEKEAKKIMDNFFNSYQGLAKWHKQTKSRFYNQGINETRTLSGRIRYFDKSTPQQILNTPVQGLGADMLKLALSKLVTALKGLDCKILATVHDEIILEARENIADKVASILSEVMVEAGKEFLKLVPVEAEASIGDNWSDKS